MKTCPLEFTVAGAKVKCGRPLFSGEMCAGHYMQVRRGQELRPLQAKKGEGEQISINMPRELREAAQVAAKKVGEGEAEFWRGAARERVERLKGRKR